MTYLYTLNSKIYILLDYSKQQRTLFYPFANEISFDLRSYLLLIQIFITLSFLLNDNYLNNYDNQHVFEK